MSAKGNAPRPGTGRRKDSGQPSGRSYQRIPKQKDRVRRFLRRRWTCGVDFLRPDDGYPPILRYTGRIHELRHDGWLIDRRPCKNPDHNHLFSTMWQWRIAGRVDDTEAAR